MNISVKEAEYSRPIPLPAGFIGFYTSAFLRSKTELIIKKALPGNHAKKCLQKLMFWFGATEAQEHRLGKIPYIQYCSAEA